MPTATPPAARVATGGLSAPGPGRWTRDAARYPRPVTPTLARLLPAPAVRGFRAATRAYGLLVDHIEWAFVDGWAYMAPRRTAPLAGAAIEDRAAWDALVAASAGLRRRLAVSARVFESRVWRTELDAWDRRDRPATAAANTAIAQVDPAGLGDEELTAHLRRCRGNLQRAIAVHHRYDVTPAVAVGDLLLHVAEWTGRRPSAHLGLLGGGGRSPLAATERGIEVAGWWIAGSTIDIDEPGVAEVPGLLAGAAHGAAGPPPETRAGEVHDLAAEVRAAISSEHRSEFDTMLVEARAAHRVRDERALYADIWATGLLRRAVLAAGARLCDRGVLGAPQDAVEAEPAELSALLVGRRRHLASALGERGLRRRAAQGREVPEVLGDAPWRPIPPDWLPPGAARTERAFRAFLTAMDDDPPPATAGTARGLPASPGVHVGRARVVAGAADLSRVTAGDVLVAPAASPTLIVVLPLVGALVTDHGGMLSHAANVAREAGVPAVVGTGDATSRIPDGAEVRVDGGTGVVTVLDPAG